ncbi:MAG: hypothetical protein ACRDOI_40840, partial [Trebonia sp.]
MSTGNLHGGNAVAPAVPTPGSGTARALLDRLDRIRRPGRAPRGEASWGATIAQLVALAVVAVVFAASGVPAQYITLGVT